MHRALWILRGSLWLWATSYLLTWHDKRPEDCVAARWSLRQAWTHFGSLWPDYAAEGYAPVDAFREDMSYA